MVHHVTDASDDLGDSLECQRAALDLTQAVQHGAREAALPEQKRQHFAVPSRHIQYE